MRLNKEEGKEGEGEQREEGGEKESRKGEGRKWKGEGEGKMGNAIRIKKKLQRKRE